MYACVSSHVFLVLINGVSEGFFINLRGLRQGNPLSPYLFIMVREVVTYRVLWWVMVMS